MSETSRGMMGDVRVVDIGFRGVSFAEEVLQCDGSRAKWKVGSPQSEFRLPRFLRQYLAGV